MAAGIIGPGGSRRRFRPYQDLRHTSLTYEAAAGNPISYIQYRAGHKHVTTTERYIHAAQVMFPGAAKRAEDRILGAVNRPARS
jgi:integrase